MLLADPRLDPQEEAAVRHNKPAAENGVDVKTALDGARDILSERFAEHELLANYAWMWEQGIVSSKVAKGERSRRS